MSIWSTLAKIGGAVAAPFTGGASLALTALGGLGDVAGAASQGRASGREAEANYLLDRDKLAMQRAAQERGDQFQSAGLDLQRRQQGDQLDSSNMKRCLLYTSDAADERSSVDLGGRRI